MSQPLKSTILAPIWRWTAFSAVLRGVATSGETDKIGSSLRARTLLGKLEKLTQRAGNEKSERRVMKVSCNRHICEAT